MMARTAYLLLVGVSCMALAGCQTLAPGKVSGTGSKNASAGVAGAIASAAQDATGSGMLKESLLFHERLYHSDPNNPEYIINYARDLRRAGRTNDAQLVIRTPAKKAKASAEMLTEAALVMVSSGSYTEGLTFAQKAVEKDGKSSDTHHALALALSGLDKHADAQLQFQEALELWPEKRDRTAIINNLAMSLAAQGKIQEARTVMSLATGEALRSRTYQNNRVLLGTLEDRAVKAETLEEIIPDLPAAADADKPVEVKPADVAAGEKPAKKPAPAAKPRKMRPIVDE